MDSVDSDIDRTNADAYIRNGRYNFVALDWGPLASGIYTNAVSNLVNIADKMADVLIALHADGLSFTKVHIVGHSLGGQMSGLIGDGIRKKSGSTLIIDRITALDPAGPLFWKLLNLIPVFVREITGYDAVIVDIIHSDAGFLGEPNSCGRIDFWPNSGTRFAPGCPVVSSLLSIEARE